MGLSTSEQERLIERIEGTSTEEDIGAITNANSVLPYQTAWGIIRDDTTIYRNGFKNYCETGSYYNLLFPDHGEDASCWIASRCTIAGDGISQFGMFICGIGESFNGMISYNILFDNYGGDTGNGESGCVLPIVSLNVNLLEWNEELDSFIVK